MLSTARTHTQPGKRVGFCVTAGSADEARVSDKRFPVATTKSECAAVYANGDALKAGVELDATRRRETQLEAVTHEVEAVTARLGGGTTYFDTCPAELWSLYRKQAKLQRTLLGKTALVGGVDYSVDGPMTKLSDVMGQYGDLKDAATLYANGFKADDVVGVVSGAVGKLIAAAIKAAAQRVLSVSQVTAQIYQSALDPACVFALCVAEPNTRGTLTFPNWPYGDRTVASIRCPACTHVALPLGALHAKDTATHAKLVTAANGLVSVCRHVQANPLPYTTHSPFRTSKPAKAIQSFLTAARQLVSGGYTKVGGVPGVDQAVTDVTAALAVYGAPAPTGPTEPVAPVVPSSVPPAPVNPADAPPVVLQQRLTRSTQHLS